MGLSAGAIFGIILALVLVAVLGYVGYKYTSDSKKYNEVKDSSSNSGSCQDPAAGTRVQGEKEKAALTSSLCQGDCDATSGCVGYEWDTGNTTSKCSLFTQTPTVVTPKTGANCYAKGSPN